MANIKIQESIHHGDYRHKRVIEVYALTPLTVKGILMSSAYPDVEPSPEYLNNILTNLKEQGAAQHGWADFEIVES
jgi:hypothetical protein